MSSPGGVPEVVSLREKCGSSMAPEQEINKGPGGGGGELTVLISQVPSEPGSMFT